MKVKMIVALSLATTSFSCLAFRSPPNTIQAASDKLSTLESNILGSFYSQHKAIPQTTIMGTCSASPVPGCSCPFCTMLRSQNR
ncbi:hypothetical protein CI665_026595 [Klebsiella quasipneumoniae subsp. similipneumoniae]|uniref:Lipoprotein n=1 Tax=Salmonella enterica subsp. enterica serovar Poona TaxID=436295 RepID=A0A731UPZ1_SALET|nr:hypothetical protein CR231_26170 [Klebsiella pneumoniae]MQT11002.1 hypothetical protein [Klebsiella pneumoniae subsp. pneumoniae]TNJ70376.1 hypothetical protein CI665_026595 [Klebsiella quasipneumoniae subsp. similipneumoniae]HAE4776409.1 hypothetical protein [Salmonella enterica subsp. enterica serovar Poona]HBW8924450.1 hypothetical protein [Klebsiella pneumoniae subsp. pneumoniae 1158]HBZ0070494.1 hypothetical protein [Klebsiella pneumoniae subsp. ozaenae]